MSKRDKWIIGFLWLAVTAINIDKAYHIDDSFHLESAKWIWDHPLTPMSGQINWYENPEDMHHFNQPPLLFYLIALVAGLFGYSEPVLHLIIAFFSFLSLWYFNRLLIYFKAEHRYFLLALFALCPAFIINQNLMTDIPILSLELGFLYHFFQEEQRRKHLIYAMLFLSGALLIKYSMIPLLVAALIGVCLKKEYRSIKYLLIPLGFLVLWTLWNKLEYGGIHIKDRPKNDIGLKMIWEQFVALLSCIGSVLPVPFLLWSGVKKSRAFIWLSVTSIVLFSVFAILVYTGHFDIGVSNSILRNLFIVIGALMLAALMYIVVIEIRTLLIDKNVNLHYNFIVLFIMLGAMALFLLLYAPFMATRHVLLLMPYLFILLIPLLNNTGVAMRWVSVLTVAVLGVILGISDWLYADFYRTMPAQIQLEDNRKVWTVGHWGWQWYARQQGFEFYSRDSSEVELGDYMVYPRHISRQQFDTGTLINELKELSYHPNAGTFFSVHNFASLYNSYHNKPSWEFSKVYIDTVVIGQIVGFKPRKWQSTHSK